MGKLDAELSTKPGAAVAVRADFCISSTFQLRSNVEWLKKCMMNIQSIWERQRAAVRKKRENAAVAREALKQLKMSLCSRGAGIKKGQTRSKTQVQRGFRVKRCS